MLVKIITGGMKFAHPDHRKWNVQFYAQRGDEVEVDEEWADALVAGGHATLLGDSPVREVEVVEPECIEDPEPAVETEPETKRKRRARRKPGQKREE